MTRFLPLVAAVALSGCAAGQTHLEFLPRHNPAKHVAPVLVARGHVCPNALEALTVESELLVETSGCVKGGKVRLTYEWTDRTGHLGQDVDFACTVDSSTGAVIDPQGFRRDEEYVLVEDAWGRRLPSGVTTWETTRLDGDAGVSLCHYALGILTGHLYELSSEERTPKR